MSKPTPAESLVHVLACHGEAAALGVITQKAKPGLGVLPLVGVGDVA